jgi:TolA-binding protein
MSQSIAPDQSGNEGPRAFAEAFENTKAIFDGLSTKQRLALLKSIGGLYGHRVLPGLGAGPSGPVQAIKASSSAKRTSQPKSQKTAAQLEAQKEISQINREISRLSKESGTRLPSTHPLLERRSFLFRAMREGKGSRSAEQSPATEKKTPDGKASEVSKDPAPSGSGSKGKQVAPT